MLVFLILGVAICSGPYFLGRAAARRWLGIVGVRVFSLDAEGSYFALSRSRRWSWRASGSLATYTTCIVVAFGSFLVVGDTVTTTTVLVQPQGPAARAGMQTGDRIVSIDGTEPQNWDESDWQMLR